MNKWQEFIEIIGKNRIKENEHAKLYVEVERIDDLINITKQAGMRKIPFYIIGTGSLTNLPTGQINGLLMKNNCRKFDIFTMSGKMREGQMGISNTLVYAESGTIMNQLVRFTIEEGYSGLEYHLGLPGTVGGAIYTNARYTPKNIYINDFVEKIKILNKGGEIQEVNGDYFISRAKSNFSQVENIILSSVFRLVPEDKKLLWQRANESAEYRIKLLNK